LENSGRKSDILDRKCPDYSKIDAEGLGRLVERFTATEVHDLAEVPVLRAYLRKWALGDRRVLRGSAA
jgi:hypothetical protein